MNFIKCELLEMWKTYFCAQFNENLKMS